MVLKSTPAAVSWGVPLFCCYSETGRNPFSISFSAIWTAFVAAPPDAGGLCRFAVVATEDFRTHDAYVSVLLELVTCA